MRKSLDPESQLLPRDDVFETRLGGYIDLARGVTVYDPYAADCLISGNRARHFLVDHLLKSNIEQMTIFCAIPNDPGGATMETENAKRILAEKLESKLRFLGNPRLKVEVSVHRRSPSIFHRRLLRLSFDRNCVEVQLEKGLDTFMNEQIFSNDVNELPAGELTPYLQNLPAHLFTVRNWSHE
jgi:hypothetical protein